MSNVRSNKKRFPLAARLGTSASLLTLVAMGAVSPAYAQDDEEVIEEEVIVRGMRSSIQSAQQLKKAANKIQDSIVAEDIGKLPDRSIAEALQRVPGVSVSRFDDPGDPEHFAGEGAGVSVRGLPQVRAELNGRDIFSAADGRALSFDDVPAELMAGVDVIKSPTADMIEGGLGGIVNLRTRMPFDQDDQLVSATVKGNYGDQISETNFEGSVLYSNNWDTNIGKLGVLVDFSNSETSARADNLYVRAYFPRDNIEGFEGQTVHVSKGADWRRNDYTRVRNGKYIAIQLEPNDELEIYLTSFESRAKRDWYENAFFTGSGDNDIASVDAGEDWVVDSDGIFQAGTVQGFNLGTSSRISSNTSKTTDISLGFEWNDGAWTVAGDAQRVLSDAVRTDNTVGTVVFPPRVYFANMTSESGPTIRDVDNVLEDLENYSFGQMMQRPADNIASSDSWRLDVEYEFEDSIINSVKSGVRYSKKLATNREGNNWSARVQPWNIGAWVDNGEEVPTIDPGSSLMDQFGFGAFQRGEADVPVDAWVFNRAAIDDFVGTTSAMIEATPAPACCSWAVSQPNYINIDPNSRANRSEQEESSSALYLMADFSLGDDFGGNVGVRYVTTENRSHGYLTSESRDFDGVQPWYFAPIPLFTENDYSHVLPSMNLRYDGIEDVVLRFSAAKGIWKPEFWRLKSVFGFSVNNPEVDELEAAGITDTNGDMEVTMADVDETNFQLVPWRYRVSTGGTNPLIEPMTANQYDISAEWYFNDDGGMLYAGAFYKDVADFFRVNNFSYPSDGIVWEGDSYINIGTADVSGFEVGGTYYFDFLPEPFNGLGVSANYTYIDSSTEIPVLDSEELNNPDTERVDPVDVDGDPIIVEELDGLSENTFNLTLMYENDTFYTRLAYNYSSSSLQSIGPNGWKDGSAWRLPVFADDYGQLDFSAGININDYTSVNFEAYNIGKAETKGFMRQNEAGENPAFVYTNDARYGLSLRITL